MSSRSSPSATPLARTKPLPPDPSSSNSIPHTSSPLNINANTSPAKSATHLPKSSPKSSPKRSQGGPSSPRSSPPEYSEPLQPLSMTVTNADAAIALPDIYDDSNMSTFRNRSRSPPRDRNADQGELSMGDSKLATSWWGEKHVTIPWRSDAKKRQKTLPEEHAIAFQETRKRVAKAAVSVLGTTADIIHETLIVGVDLLEFAPVPGLAIAAKTLVNIWDSAQNVDMNELSCLRLTERCADILLSVREEIYDAGDRVGTELAAPISKLEEAYQNIYRFMHKQAHRPWLKRYIKREEIMRDIMDCDNMLRDALTLFGVSIQIRILKQVQENDRHRQYETRAVLRAILQGDPLPQNEEIRIITESVVETTSPEPSPYIHSAEFATETVTDFTTTRTALGLMEENLPPSDLDHAHLIPALEKIHDVQNDIDASRDISSLRQLMRAALATKTDREMLEVLQIEKPDMPDAIKTLQRARERLAEREEEDLDSSVHSDINGRITRKLTVRETDGDGPSGIKITQRSETIVSIDSSSSSNESSGRSSSKRQRDTLDWEFLEMGIDCLTRMTGAQAAVPNWTITKFEVDREDKIGVGFFSDVYKGTWKGRTVAIKVLAETTPRKLFVREIGIWKKLQHPNVLPLYGASSATGDTPWFFVSPYLQNGTLVEYLKRVEQEQRPANLGVGVGANLGGFRRLHGRALSLPGPWGLFDQPSGSRPTLDSTQSDPHRLTPPGTPKRPLRDMDIVPREWDLFRFMHEISKGMEYLHKNGVLHGDLKASNVLVDQRYRCVIADFGQSEMKNEAFRISGYPPHQGTLRWQAPEFMSGVTTELTQAGDVWSFAITCVEILTMGRVPWPFMDDDAVRHFVLKDDTRPPLPTNSRFYTPKLQELLRNSWQRDPTKRFTFAQIARQLKLLRKSYGQDTTESPRNAATDELAEPMASPSPDMRPRDPLPQYLQSSGPVPPDVLSDLYVNLQSAAETSNAPQEENTIATDTIRFPEPVLWTPASSRNSSVRVPRAAGRVRLDEAGYESAPPEDEELAQQQNERRYRILLTHEYHPSLVLPLWQPTPVEIGAVGYLAKPEGTFVTFFNAYNPSKSDHPGIQSLPSIYGYGQVKDGVQRQPKQTLTQRAIEIIGSLTSRNTSQPLTQRTSFPLKAGHPVAYLYAENPEYRYIETLDAPKRWFQIHVEAILRIYGYQAKIAREDLCMIIGTLRTPKYALMVSHQHAEGHAHFNVYSNPKAGKPWGTFTMDNHVPRELGPTYDFDEVDEGTRPPACKISNHNGTLDAVLLARLRFKTDASEPTSR